MVQPVITSTRIPRSQSRARRPCHDGFVATKVDLVAPFGIRAEFAEYVLFS